MLPLGNSVNRGRRSTGNIHSGKLQRQGEVTKSGISYTSGWWFTSPGQIPPSGEQKACVLLQDLGKTQTLSDRALGPEESGKEPRFVHSTAIISDCLQQA